MTEDVYIVRGILGNKWFRAVCFASSANEALSWWEWKKNRGYSLKVETVPMMRGS